LRAMVKVVTCTLMYGGHLVEDAVSASTAERTTRNSKTSLDSFDRHVMLTQ